MNLNIFKFFQSCIFGNAEPLPNKPVAIDDTQVGFDQLVESRNLITRFYLNEEKQQDRAVAIRISQVQAKSPISPESLGTIKLFYKLGVIDGYSGGVKWSIDELMEIAREKKENEKDHKTD